MFNEPDFPAGALIGILSGAAASTALTATPHHALWNLILAWALGLPILQGFSQHAERMWTTSWQEHRLVFRYGA